MRRNLATAVAASLFGALLTAAWPVLAQSEWGVRGPSRTSNANPAMRRTTTGSTGLNFIAEKADVYGVLASFCNGTPACPLSINNIGNPALTVGTDATSSGVYGAAGLKLGASYAGDISLTTGISGGTGHIILTPTAAQDVIFSTKIATDDRIVVRPFAGGAAARYDLIQTTADITASNKVVTWQNWTGNVAVSPNNGAAGEVLTSTGLTTQPGFATAPGFGLTQYGVLYGGGAGPPVATAAGTTGQVFTGVTGGAPVWAAPAGGGLPAALFYGTGADGTCAGWAAGGDRAVE